jgi:hypothetical protein
LLCSQVLHRSMAAQSQEEWLVGSRNLAYCSWSYKLELWSHWRQHPWLQSSISQRFISTQLLLTSSYQPTRLISKLPKHTSKILSPARTSSRSELLHTSQDLLSSQDLLNLMLWLTPNSTSRLLTNQLWTNVPHSNSATLSWLLTTRADTHKVNSQWNTRLQPRMLTSMRSQFQLIRSRAICQVPTAH